MKLNEIKNLLADGIETYSTTIRKKDEKGELYDYEYELEPSKQDPALRFMNVLFGNNQYDKLEELEVKAIYSGKNGFIIDLRLDDATLFEKIAKENKIPLRMTKYSVVED